jgi:peptidoglycan/xylan/chitin deacetylase (PgdA/CDA1 family)
MSFKLQITNYQLPMLLAAAASLASYASVSPTSQLWGKTVARLAPGEIALTYDDGPNDGTTQLLLEVLAEAEVRATFFLIGRYVRQQPALVRQIQQAGHTLGNHSDTHPNLIWTSPARTRDEIIRCQQSIEDAAGVSVRLFRPPFGMRRPDTLRIARELGLTPVMWNVTCYDWKPTATATSIIDQTQRQMRPHSGAILLLHDGGHLAFGADRLATIEATRRLLQRYERSRFVGIGIKENQPSERGAR